ncbi:MAG: insulinase family protein [Deinococcota bacterium]|nr:insulinase family protein [Deinococcota bacterium]
MSSEGLTGGLTERAGLEFHRTTLDNGLTVIGERNPRAQSFAAGYFVRTGARDETQELSGVSHFLEHMMFRGSARRGGDEVLREFDELGAKYNAYTSDETTVYYGSVLPERAGALLDLLSDMMRPLLRETDFETEKKVILEEIAMYEDRPAFKVFEEGGRLYYRGHPLGNPVLGSSASIRTLSRGAMLDYFRARYAPNNLVLALSGRYDWEAVLAQVSALTAEWQPQDAPRRYPELRPARGRQDLESAKLKRVHAVAYAPGVSAADPLRFAAGILASCLGASSGSRLYWALVDGGLADSASLSHDGADGSGSFVGYLSCAPGLAPQVLDIFERTLQDAQAGGLEAGEWERAQRKLATGLTLGGETPFGRLMSLGSSYLYTGDYRSVPALVERIMNTGLDEADRLLARRPFDALFTAVLGPGA